MHPLRGRPAVTLKHHIHPFLCSWAAQTWIFQPTAAAADTNGASPAPKAAEPPRQGIRSPVEWRAERTRRPLPPGNQVRRSLDSLMRFRRRLAGARIEAALQSEDSCRRSQTAPYMEPAAAAASQSRRLVSRRSCADQCVAALSTRSCRLSSSQQDDADLEVAALEMLHAQQIQRHAAVVLRR